VRFLLRIVRFLTRGLHTKCEIISSVSCKFTHESEIFSEIIYMYL